MVISFVSSYILCGTEQNDSSIDSIKLEEYTAVLGNRVSFIVLTDSVGNEPEDETAKFYVLKKVKNMRLIKNVDSNFATHVFYKS